MAVWEHKASVLKLIWRALVFPLFLYVVTKVSQTGKAWGLHRQHL